MIEWNESKVPSGLHSKVIVIIANKTSYGYIIAKVRSSREWPGKWQRGGASARIRSGANRNRNLTMTASKSPSPQAPSLGLKDIYLIAYNGMCCLGWAYVLMLGVPSIIVSVSSSVDSGSDTSLLEALKLAGSNLYFATPSTAGWSDESSPSLALALTIVQSAALLEIVHAAVGLVRSPVFVTAMQVGSRIVALHMINTSPKAQSKFICSCGVSAVHSHTQSFYL